jgi:hypothetical protein
MPARVEIPGALEKKVKQSFGAVIISLCNFHDLKQEVEEDLINKTG